MVQAMYQEWSKPAKSHNASVVIKRWHADNEWEAGNKWFKLKYNLLQLQEKGYTGWMSIGGPWSNHLSAMAYAGRKLQIPSIGLLRGEWRIQSPTLAMMEMEKNGMQLHGLPVTMYEVRESEDFKVWIRDQYPGYYFIPEGGSNYWGLMGAMEMLDEFDKSAFDHIWVAGGTGTTAAGLLLAASLHQQVHVAFALKAPETELKEMVRSKLRWVISEESELNELMERLTVYSDDRWGGYGKGQQELFDYINSAERDGFQWDRVYNGKLAWMMDSGSITLDKRNLIIHTGGLQGNRSFTSA
jgi:1-aminocyclopropane-1-carboxylate deaminase